MMIRYINIFCFILGGGISLIGNPSGPPAEKDSALLLDILGDINFGNSTQPSNNPPATSLSSTAQQGGSLLDMLGDDLDMTSPTQPPSTSILSQNNQPPNLLDGLTAMTTTSPTRTFPPISQNNNLNDLFNSIPPMNNGSGNSTAEVNNIIPNMVGYNNNDISITFQFDRPSPSGSLVNMNLNIVNMASIPASDFVLQAAVPKSMQLEMLPASSTDIPANGTGSINLTLKVNNPSFAALKMRLKLSFNRGGQSIQDATQVSNFPPELTMTA